MGVLDDLRSGGRVVGVVSHVDELRARIPSQLHVVRRENGSTLRVQSPLAATVVNFAGGTAVLVVAALVHGAIVGAPRALPADPWLYLGGSIGVVYIFLSSVIVQRTGVLVLGLGSVVGLLTTSVVLDALWPAPAAPPTPLAILAAAVAIAGVVVAAVPWSRWRSRR